MFYLTYFVVGYAQTELTSGATMIVPQFGNVGGVANEFSLKSFKAVGEECSDNVFISTLNPYGGKIATYVWINYGGESGEEEIWADADTYAEPTTEVTFEPGSALWIEGISGNQAIQASGQVITSDTPVQLCDGATQAGNPTPIDLQLQDILATGEECSDNVFISTLNPYGGKISSYVWINYGGDSGEEELWADADTYAEPETAVTFAPGLGLWIEGTSDAQYVTFPGVELN